MQRSLCQLSAAIVLAACLLLQSVHSQPIADQNSRQFSAASALETYLALKALLSADNTLPEFLYDDIFNDMERSRRSGPMVEAFTPVSMNVLRRLLKSRQAQQQASVRQNIIDRNSEIMRNSGRR